MIEKIVAEEGIWFAAFINPQHASAAQAQEHQLP
jgi:hypothetical protein